MNRLYMLDTNTVSDIIKHKSPAARAALKALPPTAIACVSSITEAEIRFGLARTPSAHERIRAAELFLKRIKLLSWGRSEAQAYGVLRAHQEALGRILASMDMLIAAHAIATGAILVTRDRAFQHVQGLIGTENWATDL